MQDSGLRLGKGMRSKCDGGSVLGEGEGGGDVAHFVWLDSVCDVVCWQSLLSS